jgi:hypothetical protein
MKGIRREPKGKDDHTILLSIGLVLAKIEPFYESLFFVSVISFLMIFLLMLIRDLDNPFGYYDRYSGEDVSLKPLEDAVGRLGKIASVISPINPDCCHRSRGQNSWAA